MMQMERLAGLVLHPTATFAEIAQRPTFAAAWLTAWVFFVLPFLAAVHRIGAERLFAPLASVAQLQPGLAGAPPDEIAAAIALVFEFFVIVIPIIAIPLTALCLMPFVPAVGAQRRPRFRPLLAVTAYATLPPALGMCFTACLVLLLRDPARLSLDSLAPLNLGWLLRTPRWLHGIASTIELFSAWSVYLISHGVAAVSGAPFRRVLLALAVPLILFAWLLAAVAAML